MIVSATLAERRSWRVFGAIFAAAAIVRFAIAIYSWDLLRFDDLYPLTQPRQWAALQAIWSGFGRVLPGGVFGALDSMAPHLPLTSPIFRLLALGGICTAIATAVWLWQVQVHWLWRVAAGAIAAAHPFWVDIVQFRCNDVATAAGMLGCTGAFVAMSRQRFGWLEAAGLALTSGVIVASYQPFIYLPVLWALLNAAMLPAELGPRLRRFFLQTATVLSAMALYVLLLRVAHIEGRTALVSGFGEATGHVLKLVLLPLIKNFAISDPIDGPVPRWVGFLLLIAWLTALVKRGRADAARNGQRFRIGPFLLFALILLSLLTSPLHAVLADPTPPPPRLMTQLSLFFAAIAVTVGAWCQGRRLAVPGVLLAVMGAGFLVGSVQTATVQRTIWQRDLDIADYVAAEIARQPDIAEPQRLEVRGHLDSDWAYGSLGLERQFFSIFFSNFSNNSEPAATMTLPFMAWHGGYLLPAFAYGDTPQRRDPADLDRCATAFDAPPPPAGGPVTEEQVRRFGSQIRVLVQQGAPLICLGQRWKS